YTENRLCTTRTASPLDLPWQNLFAGDLISIAAPIRAGSRPIVCGNYCFLISPPRGCQFEKKQTILAARTLKGSAMALPPQHKPPLQRLALYCALVGGLATLLWTAWTANRIWLDKQALFEDRAALVLGGVATQITASMAMTRSFQAYFDASEAISADEFSIFASTQLRSFPYIDSAFFAPLISADERGNFEQLLSQSELPAVITDAGNNGKTVASPARDFYFPVWLATSTRPTRAVQRGIDIYPLAPQIMEEAFERNEVRVLPAKLIPRSIDHVALLVPIYRKLAPPRRNEVIGMVGTLLDKYQLIDRSVFGSNMGLDIFFSERSGLQFGVDIADGEVAASRW